MSPRTNKIVGTSLAPIYLEDSKSKTLTPGDVIILKRPQSILSLRNKGAVQGTPVEPVVRLKVNVGNIVGKCIQTSSFTSTTSILGEDMMSNPPPDEESKSGLERAPPGGVKAEVSTHIAQFPEFILPNEGGTLLSRSGYLPLPDLSLDGNPTVLVNLPLLLSKYGSTQFAVNCFNGSMYAICQGKWVRLANLVKPVADSYQGPKGAKYSLT